MLDRIDGADGPDGLGTQSLTARQTISMQIQECFMRSIDNIIGYSGNGSDKERVTQKQRHGCKCIVNQRIFFRNVLGISLKTYFPQAWGDPQRILESILLFIFVDFLRENLKNLKNLLSRSLGEAWDERGRPQDSWKVDF